MADDNTLVQRQPEQPSEIGRHGGYGHNCCLATHCNGALQNARRAKPLEYAEPTFGGQILPIGERACFAMRVSPKYRDYPAERCQRKRRPCQALNEAMDGYIATDAKRNSE